MTHLVVVVAVLGLDLYLAHLDLAIVVGLLADLWVHTHLVP